MFLASARSTEYFNRQKESEMKSISERNSIIVQHLQEAYPLSRTFAKVITCCWMTCWTIVGYRSEIPFLSLSFCLTAPVFRTFLYHCRMAHDDGGFYIFLHFTSFFGGFYMEDFYIKIHEDFDVMFLHVESLFTRIGKGWRSNHECQHWTFYSSDLIHDAECTVHNLTNFFTSSFLVLICNKQ